MKASEHCLHQILGKMNQFGHAKACQASLPTLSGAELKVFGPNWSAEARCYVRQVFGELLKVVCFPVRSRIMRHVAHFRVQARLLP